MIKDQILSKIRSLADDHGGHISFDNFLAEAALFTQKIIGKHWTKWNDALAEAGVATKEFFIPRMDENYVIEAFARLTERLGKWPTRSELEFEQHNNSSFPSEGVFRRLRKKKSLAVTILDTVAPTKPCRLQLVSQENG